MTGESKSPQDDNKEQIRAMLELVGRTIEDEEYDEMLEITDSQELLSSVNLADYLLLKYKNEEDPVTQRRWEDGLDAFLGSLEGQEFTEEEHAALDDIENRFRFDSITANEEVAEVPLSEIVDCVQDSDDLETDTYTIDMDKDEITHIRSLSLFREAERIAVSSPADLKREYLEKAHDLIADNTEGEIYERMMQVFSYTVLGVAKDYVDQHPITLKFEAVQQSVDMIVEHAPDDDTEVRMRAAFDKDILDAAKQHIDMHPDDSKIEATGSAKELIDVYASTPQRRNEMFRLLGFM